MKRIVIFKESERLIVALEQTRNHESTLLQAFMACNPNYNNRRVVTELSTIANIPGDRSAVADAIAESVSTALTIPVCWKSN